MSNDVPVELLFSAAFPLPFRVLSLAGFGIFGWATNLHGLYLAGVDSRTVLDLDYYDVRSRRPVSPLPVNARPNSGWGHAHNPAALYRPLYHLLAVYSLWTLNCWVVYRFATYGDLYRVDTYKFIPGIAILVVLTALVSPFNVLAKTERDKFFHAIHRCLFPPYHRVHFADVVFADIFTSFAKVLGDVWLSLCMLMPGGSLLAQPSQQGWMRWILPTLMSLPYFVRFRQCLIDYRSPSNDSRRPLYNALKYATSFPVIYLSAAQRMVAQKTDNITETRESSRGERILFQLWLLAAAVNSLYSFWWDVTHDWGFDLLLRSTKSGIQHHRAHRSPSPRPFAPSRLHSGTALLPSPSSPSFTAISSDDTKLDAEDTESNSEVRKFMLRPSWYPFGLRPNLLFPLPVYPFVILADLVLRLTWSVKLSSHLHAFAEGDLLIFCFEFAEVVRRWMWVFVRVEWELVKEGQDIRPRYSLDGEQTDSIREDDYEMVRSELSSRIPSPVIEGSIAPTSGINTRGL